MHYAVPRILEAAGRLRRFYTDLCAVKGWPKMLRAVPEGMRPAHLQRVMDRVPRGVAPERITAFTRLGWKYARRRVKASSPDQLNALYLWAGRTFCHLILEDGLGEGGGVYLFNTAALEVLEAARARGLRAVLEQTSTPREIEQGLMCEECLAFPSWEVEPRDEGYLAELCMREKAEWAEAELIVCGSDFVRAGVAASGGPAERCRVVSYGVYDMDEVPRIPMRRHTSGPLHVLTVGRIGLLKGSPYVLEAARLLGREVDFRMVGRVGVSDQARVLLGRHVEIVGPVTRLAVDEHYRWADAFLLPSLCEGSATATYEALSWGLPVVCTPNTGSVVRDGVDGFIVPIRDAKAIVERIERLARSKDLWAEMSKNARRRALEFSLARYGQNLLATLDDDVKGNT